MTTCSKCGDPKEPWELYRGRNYCNECHKKSRRVKGFRTDNLRRLYNISLGEYDVLLRKQGGRCKICGTSQPGGNGDHFAVDHCHRTQKVRGLLCNSCNNGLGRFKDNPLFLERAALYLQGKL